MIGQSENPEAWALLRYQLDDAAEALASLVAEMGDPEFGEPEFRVGLAHVYGHLNRAWHMRTGAEALDPSQAEFEHMSRFPDDLDPVRPFR